MAKASYELMVERRLRSETSMGQATAEPELRPEGWTSL